MLSRRAARGRPPPESGGGISGAWWPPPRPYRGDDMWRWMSRGRLPCDCEWPWPLEGEDRCMVPGGTPAAGVSEKGTTPARRAISTSPSCQCIASAALHGTCISSATFAHISGLNLPRIKVSNAPCSCFCGQPRFPCSCLPTVPRRDVENAR